MTLDDMRAMARARIAHLTAMRGEAVRTGDAVSLARIDAELGETEATLTTLEQL